MAIYLNVDGRYGFQLKNSFIMRSNATSFRLASVAGAVTQATGGPTFEDGLRSFVEVSGPKGVNCVRTSLSEVIVGVGGTGWVRYRRQLTIAVCCPNMSRPNV